MDRHTFLFELTAELILILLQLIKGENIGDSRWAGIYLYLGIQKKSKNLFFFYLFSLVFSGLLFSDLTQIKSVALTETCCRLEPGGAQFILQQAEVVVPGGDLFHQALLGSSSKGLSSSSAEAQVEGVSADTPCTCTHFVSLLSCYTSIHVIFYERVRAVSERIHNTL